MIDKAPQYFPRDEFMRRIAAVKQEMAARDVHAFVVTDDSNITYLTGYTAKSGYVPQGLVLSVDIEEPTILLRRQDAPAAFHQSFLRQENIVGYSEDLIGNPEKNGYDAVIDFLRDIRVDDKNVGLESAGLRTADVEKFTRALRKAQIKDLSGVVTWIRLVKSDREISLMREVAVITDSAIERASEVLRSGVREPEAVAEIMARLVRGVGGISSTDVTNFFLCSTPRTSTPHVPWSEDTLTEGSQVNLELSGMRYGYVAPAMRTFSIGRAAERLKTVHSIEIEGLEAALAAVEPGRTCGDVAKAFYSTIEARGLSKDSRCGYAVGINWLEPTASLKLGDPTILKPNMTFHLMLGNWIDADFGYVLSETFRVADNGAEVLTASPRDLYELE